MGDIRERNPKVHTLIDSTLIEEYDELFLLKMEFS